MNRREYLAVAGVPLLASLAGCLGEGPSSESDGPGEDTERRTGTGTDGRNVTAVPSASRTSEVSDPADEIRIVVRNSTSSEATVRLSVATGGGTTFAEEVRLAPDTGTSVDPGIDETGRYELAVTVDGGPEESYPFGVEEYDLRMGSNLIVTIDDDDVRLLMEE